MRNVQLISTLFRLFGRHFRQCWLTASYGDDRTIIRTFFDKKIILRHLWKLNYFFFQISTSHCFRVRHTFKNDFLTTLVYTYELLFRHEVKTKDTFHPEKQSNFFFPLVGVVFQVVDVFDVTASKLHYAGLLFLFQH